MSCRRGRDEEEFSDYERNLKKSWKDRREERRRKTGGKGTRKDMEGDEGGRGEREASLWSKSCQFVCQ